MLPPVAESPPSTSCRQSCAAISPLACRVIGVPATGEAHLNWIRYEGAGLWIAHPTRTEKPKRAAAQLARFHKAAI